MNDLISRQAAIDAIEHRLAEPAYLHTGEDWYVGMNCAESEIYELPSAQPERKKGCKIVKGTGHYGYCACDQCGKPVHPEDRFCSKCGVDFREDDT